MSGGIQTCRPAHSPWRLGEQGSRSLAAGRHLCPDEIRVEDLHRQLFPGENAHFVYVRGNRDTARVAWDFASMHSLRDWCVFNVEYQTNNFTGHEVMSPEALSGPLDSLAKPVEADAGRLAKCRAGIDGELESKLRQVQSLISAGNRDAARDMKEIDTRFGGLAAPQTLELESELYKPAGKPQGSERLAALAASVIKRGHIGISVEHRPQRRLERPEPGFVVAPSFNRVSKNRTADLLIAEGIEGTIILVILETGRFERRTDKVEKPPHLAFEVCDKILVDHPVDFSRQHAVEVRHQAHVIAVKAANLCQPV